MDFQELTARAARVREQYARWEQERYGRPWTAQEIALGLVGDVGDLAKLVQGKAGVRPRADLDEALSHELADCLWAVMTLADTYGVDLEAAFLRTTDDLGRSLGDSGGPAAPGHDAVPAANAIPPGDAVPAADADGRHDDHGRAAEPGPLVDDAAPAVELHVRGDLTDAELDELHATAFAHAVTRTPWRRRLADHSLTWVTARLNGRLVGFVNVVGDGGVHAVLLDTCVAPDLHGRGIGRALVRAAADEARRAGCEWLHADYEPHLVDFYERACGLRRSDAGLLRLR